MCIVHCYSTYFWYCRYVALGVALRFVMEALQKPLNSKMYLFGILALDKFRSRLREYPRYCTHLLAIDHFSSFPPHLVEVNLALHSLKCLILHSRVHDLLFLFLSIIRLTRNNLIYIFYVRLVDVDDWRWLLILKYFIEFTSVEICIFG